MDDVLHQLYRVLEKDAPENAHRSQESQNQATNGLLSVGLKLHCLDGGQQFKPIIRSLKSRCIYIEGSYRMGGSRALCFVLPPVDNVNSAINLLRALEEASGSKVFGNSKVQIQVCTPGQLCARNAALLTIAYLLGSDVIRKHVKPADTRTTFSDDYGCRVALYGAGVLQRHFAWPMRDGDGQLYEGHELPFSDDRTDLLLAQSPHDISLINFVATLLIHAEYPQHRGFWFPLGTRFIADFTGLLDKHKLSDLYLVPWIRTDDQRTKSDRPYNHAIKLLLEAAQSDSTALQKAPVTIAEFFAGARKRESLLLDVKDLLSSYQEELKHEWKKAKERSRV